MTTFNIGAVAVTHTYYYTTEDYLDYCEQNGDEPTEEGLINYLKPEIDNDFPISSTHPYTIIYNEDDND